MYNAITSITLHFLSALRSDALMPGSDGSGCTVPHNFICWNIMQSIGFYSQLAGVLAGFVFVAITLLLKPDEPQILNDSSRKQARTITLNSLFLTFFSLLISSFL